MKALGQILVATDYSAASEAALNAAAALASHFGAAITVMHVLGEQPYPHPLPPSKALGESARALLDESVARLQADGLNAWGVLREGTAWQEICSAATELLPDLVVVGSQGSSGLPRFVLGSVAERVVRLSPVPVLTVHPSDEAPMPGSVADRIGRIVAPTDLSEASQRGVDAAVTLALALGGLLTLVCVCPPPPRFHDDAASRAEAEVRRNLDEVVARVRVRLPGAEGVVRAGTPWKSILDVAKERQANLIVLSAHGRSGLQRTLLGSVAEKIVRLSPVPVLTVGAAGMQ
jgi:nucleotide-binding universal stress UspA family protein